MKMISSRTHTMIGLIVGAALLLAPWLFGFSDNAIAATTAWVIGALVIVNELITTSPLSLLKVVPMRAHLFVDYLTGAILALSPWLFGFADAPANAWVPHLLVGILIIGYAVMTNPASESTGHHAAAM